MKGLMVQYVVVSSIYTYVYPSSQQQMASNTLDSGGDHNARVRVAEVDARLADMIRSDFKAFQSALISLEEFLQDFFRIQNLCFCTHVNHCLKRLNVPNMRPI